MHVTLAISSVTYTVRTRSSCSDETAAAECASTSKGCSELCPVDRHLVAMRTKLLVGSALLLWLLGLTRPRGYSYLYSRPFAWGHI